MISKNRHTIRFQGYNYTASGIYYVTLDTYHWESIFGEITGQEMQLNDLGRIVEREWKRLPERFSYVELDEFIIMPNHFHGILVFNDIETPDLRVRQNYRREAPLAGSAQPNDESQVSLVFHSSSARAQRKSSCAHTEEHLIPMVSHISSAGEQRKSSREAPLAGSAPTNNDRNTPPIKVVAGSLGAVVRAFKSSVVFQCHKLCGNRNNPVWHRNYYDHIIRSQADLDRIRVYIQNNPLNWQFNQENRNQNK